MLARQPEPAQQRNYGPDSAEYRTAWLKKMAVRDGVALFGELNEEEETCKPLTDEEFKAFQEQEKKTEKKIRNFFDVIWSVFNFFT